MMSTYDHAEFTREAAAAVAENDRVPAQRSGDTGRMKVTLYSDDVPVSRELEVGPDGYVEFGPEDLLTSDGPMRVTIYLSPSTDREATG